MAFDAKLEITGGIATITLSGELDASAAPAFRAQIEKAGAQPLTRLVLIMRDLDYIASAGLRVLIFAKQKMGAAVDLYAIAPQEQVLDTFEMTGFDHSLRILTEDEADQIENV